MATTLLIFPHQLFAQHPGLQRDREILLIEDSLFFGDPHFPADFHRKKLILHRASILSYAQRLKDQDYDVRHVKYQPDTFLDDQLKPIIRKNCDELIACDPVDFILEKRLRALAAQRGLKLTLLDTPQFLTPPEWANDFFDDQKKPQMAPFYTAQRKRMEILLDSDGGPLGGKWSFDTENRKKLPKDAAVPSPPVQTSSPQSHVKAATRWVDETFADNPGRGEQFIYPITHCAAEQWLADFLEEKLGRFGDYEDAISREHRFIYHSVLTPMLNIGLLTPRQIIDATFDYAQQNEVPVNSLEGFVRQIIGWREFMRIMYTREGVSLRNGNFWGHERDMPKAFYTGDTGIDPVDHAIRSVLDHSYNHHIERLMILGNFMLLCRIHPDAVYRWFMEMYIDAYDWVMVPNVYAMSQFADGGSFTTKPYISGSNYIRKMSDFPNGDWCPVWDGLFWSFIDRNRDFFITQPRMAMMARQLDRMSSSKLQAHLEHAGGFLDGL